MATVKSKAPAKTAASYKFTPFKVTAEQVTAAKGARAVATPRRDMVIIQLGTSKAAARAAKDQQAGTILSKVGRELSKPGLDRKRLFASSSGKPVYAYFVDPADPNRMVREDQAGHRTVGKVVNGTFRPLTA